MALIRRLRDLVMHQVLLVLTMLMSSCGWMDSGCGWG
jgi:hypothetical protein